MIYSILPLMNRVLLEKPVVAQLMKKFLMPYFTILLHWCSSRSLIFISNKTKPVYIFSFILIWQKNHINCNMFRSYKCIFKQFFADWNFLTGPVRMSIHPMPLLIICRTKMCLFEKEHSLSLSLPPRSALFSFCELHVGPHSCVFLVPLVSEGRTP